MDGGDEFEDGSHRHNDRSKRSSGVSISPGVSNKRPRVTAPSKVLHVRGIPDQSPQHELEALCHPFGVVTACLMLVAKNQAFVQMGTVEAAQHLVTYYQQSPPLLNGRPVFFQFSLRQEISPEADTPAYSYAPGSDDLQPNNILLAIVHNCRMAVAVDDLYKVFSPFGRVLRIVMFVKNHRQQALVELDSVAAATAAMDGLQGRDIFRGCCTLQIEYSKRRELTVKPNSPHMRDFTIADSGSPAATPASAPSAGADRHQAEPHSGAPPPARDPPMVQRSGPREGRPYDRRQDDRGRDDRYDNYDRQQDHHHHHHHHHQQPHHRHSGGRNSHRGRHFDDRRGMRGGNRGGYGDMNMRGGAPEPGCVVIVNNLPADRVNTDVLFVLFGVYGDVMRVKILYHAPDTALIQYVNPYHAQLSVTHLDGAELLGQELSVRPSSKREITLPRANDPSGLTKRFENSPMHRYRRGMNVHNARNLCPPSQVLFCSNLPDGLSEPELIDVLGGGDKVRCVNFFQTDRRMALAVMSDVSTATETLVYRHNHRVHGRFIRLSFSKKDADKVIESANRANGEPQRNVNATAAAAAAAAHPNQNDEEYEAVSSTDPGEGMDVEADDVDMAS